MTEAEWLDCTDPMPMLDFLKGKTSNRKLRLFAVACVRRVWHLLTDARSRDAVEGAELYADGLLNEAEFFAVFWSAANALNEIRGVSAIYAASAATGCARWVFADDNHTQWEPGEAFFDAQITAKQAVRAFHPDIDKQRAAQTTLVLDVFGNPFHFVTINPGWRTPAVLHLAQAVYDNRILPSSEHELPRLAFLADALEDAGCTNPDILGHCRGPGPHVRGCWVVDLLLGKE